MRQLRLKTGFTLLEMTVVMAIMGILATAAIGAFIASQQKGRDAQRKSDLAQVQRAMEAYTADHGAYPAAVSGKIGACGASFDQACSWGDELKDSQGTVYMKRLPKDPAVNQNYVYVTSLDQRQYQLFALLENKNDPMIATYTQVCNTGGSTCNFGLSSSNTIPSEVLQ